MWTVCCSECTLVDICSKQLPRFSILISLQTWHITLQLRYISTEKCDHIVPFYHSVKPGSHLAFACAFQVYVKFLSISRKLFVWIPPLAAIARWMLHGIVAAAQWQFGKKKKTPKKVSLDNLTCAGAAIWLQWVSAVTKTLVTPIIIQTQVFTYRGNPLTLIRIYNDSIKCTTTNYSSQKT